MLYYKSIGARKVLGGGQAFSTLLMNEGMQGSVSDSEINIIDPQIYVYSTLPLIIAILKINFLHNRYLQYQTLKLMLPLGITILGSISTFTLIEQSHSKRTVS